MSFWVRKRGNCSTPFHRNPNDAYIAGNSLKHISNIKGSFLIPGNLLLQTAASASQLVCSLLGQLLPTSMFAFLPLPRAAHHPHGSHLHLECRKHLRNGH